MWLWGDGRAGGGGDVAPRRPSCGTWGRSGARWTWRGRAGRGGGEKTTGGRNEYVRAQPSQGFFSRQTAGHRFRFTGPVGLVTGRNRLNLNPNLNKFKSSRATGSDRFTGRFDRFEIQKLPCNRFTGRFDRFTDRFDRFTGRFDRFDRWAFMGRPIFFLFLF